MRITENIHALDASKGSYVYVIQGKETTLIDTGFSWAGKRMIKEIQSLGIDFKDITNILLTHYDLDHIGNAAKFQKLTDAEIWASKAEIPYIIGEKHRPGFK